MATCETSTGAQVPVVCIGFSSGGLEPVTELFQSLGPETGMAFVVIHHLRREHPSHLVPILSRCTRMPVQLAQDSLAVQPNTVYILPSGDEIGLKDGAFKLQPCTKPTGWPNIISVFVESLSQSRHPGIAVILSGMDADGAKALTNLKKHHGIVIAQSPFTAESPEMPRAAIKTGLVDYVLDGPDVGRKLTELSARFRPEETSSAEVTELFSPDTLSDPASFI